MNHHTYVESCLEHYERHGLTPEPGGEWQEAHYPAPKGVGNETIWLTFNDHQQQGLLQSEEYGRSCFFNGDVTRFLTRGPFVPEWFDLWDLYDKWSGDNARKVNPENSKAMLAHPNTITNRFENAKALNDHPNTIASRSKTGKENVKVMNDHPNTVANRRKHNERISKRVILTKLETNEDFEFHSAGEAARVLGLNPTLLSSVARGERRHHKGYTAVYI